MKVERVTVEQLRVGDRVAIEGAGSTEWTVGEHGLHLSNPPLYSVRDRLDAIAAAGPPPPRTVPPSSKVCIK